MNVKHKQAMIKFYVINRSAEFNSLLVFCQQVTVKHCR